MTPLKLNDPPATLTPGSQILAYLRDSGHADQELSIQHQRNSLESWANQHNLIITQHYIDEAKRGTTTVGRKSLAQLMADLRRHTPAAAVVVWSFSRFSRGIDEPVLYRAEIRTLGYQFVSLTDDVPEGPMGRIFEAIIDYKNHQHIADMAIGIQAALQENIRLYGIIPGTPPRGFTRSAPITYSSHRDGRPRIGHRWIPDPQTAPLITKAFQMRAAGVTLSAIQAETHLYKNINCYARMWTNQIYIGTLKFGETILENYCPPLIDQPTWQTVQAQQLRRTHPNRPEIDHPRRVTSRYILSGLARCANCGAPLVGHTSTYAKKAPQDSYLCTNAHRKDRTCNAKRIPRAPFETAILSTLKSYILNPKITHTLQTLDATTAAQAQEQNSIQIADLKKQIANIRRQLANITNALRDLEKPSKTLLIALTDLENQETTLLNKLAQNKPIKPPEKLTIEQIATRSAALTAILSTASLDDKRTIIRGLIHAITAQRTDNKIIGTIYYYTPTMTSIPPPVVVPTSNTPPGALLHRHNFTAPIKKASG